MNAIAVHESGRPAVLRLPDETHVSRVNLRTANLARVLDFYERVIGLKLRERGESGASLSATGGHPALLILTEDRNAAPRPQRATGLYHLAGYEARMAGGVLQVRDPNGHWLELDLARNHGSISLPPDGQPWP